MTSKRMSILLAAMAGLILQGTLSAAPSVVRGRGNNRVLSETKYTVEIDQDEPEPVMVLLRYRDVPEVIGTVSFTNGNGQPPQDDSNVDPVIPGDGNGGVIPGPPPNGGNGNGNGNGGSGGGPIFDGPDDDDFDDQIPSDLPGKDTQTPSVDNGGPGTLPVPEPSAVILSATGVIIIGLLKSRQQKS